ILCPTRELAGQIADSLRTYGKFVGLSGALVYGGANMRKQINAMERGVDILIATPGRLIDLMKQRAIRLDKVEHLILDEADQMLDMGFIKPIRLIVGEIPKGRQTSLFSATMPKEISHLAEELLTDPKRIQVALLSSPAERVDQKLIMVGQVNKQLVLENICNQPEVTRAMIFVRTKHGAEKVLDKLEAQGMSADAVHGNKSQNAREQALEKFRKGQTRLLVCTDVAARGIDVDGVTHVFNFDLPDVPEAYVHRIGRTARAGTEGVSISFCAPHERDNLRQIERLIKKSITKIDNVMARAPVHSKPAPAPVAARADDDQDDVFVEDLAAPTTLTLVANAHGDVVGQVRRKGPREMTHEPRNDPRRGQKPQGGRARPSGHATQSHFNAGRPQVRSDNRFGARAEVARPEAARTEARRPDQRPRFDQKYHGKDAAPRSYDSRSEGFGHRNGQAVRESATRHASPPPRGEARVEGVSKNFGAKSHGQKNGAKPVRMGRSGARGGAPVGRGGESSFTGRRGR
ncbi:MAG: hypothetical protein RLZZ157_1601, partial [Pseudomonadota bacterium]